jgi:hypothetical protein
MLDCALAVLHTKNYGQKSESGLQSAQHEKNYGEYKSIIEKKIKKRIVNINTLKRFRAYPQNR